LKNGFISFVQQQFKKEFGQQGGGGISDFWMIKSAVERIFDNLQVSVKRVNITIQDHSSNNTQIRVSLGELEMKTTDSTYMNAVYVKRDGGKNKKHVVYKRIIFSNFMVSVGPLYHNEDRMLKDSSASNLRQSNDRRIK
jgi:ribosomal protein L23